MDFLHIGLAITSVIALNGSLICLLHIRRCARQFKLENFQLKRCVSDDLDASSQEMVSRFEEIVVEVNEIHSHLIQIEQEKISWVTVNKSLPPHSTRVLLLDPQNKSEHKGFLNPSHDNWTVISPGGGMKNVSLGNFSSWKPLFHL